MCYMKLTIRQFMLTKDCIKHTENSVVLDLSNFIFTFQCIGELYRYRYTYGDSIEVSLTTSDILNFEQPLQIIDTNHQEKEITLQNLLDYSDIYTYIMRYLRNSVDFFQKQPMYLEVKPEYAIYVR